MERRALIDPGDPGCSIVFQCRLACVARSGFYYKPQEASEEEMQILRLVDEQYTRTPFYGNRRLCACLRERGVVCGRDRMRSVMQQLGIEAIYPKPRLSQGHVEHKKYPYLLRGIRLSGPNQVWSTDITYVRMSRGFVYLTAVMDWYSRYVLSWRLSTTLDNDFCCEALQEALTKGRPQIFNTDQGVQFTSRSFTGILENHDISISMDGRGRALDNVFVERLWRTIKYENIYVTDYCSVRDVKEGVSKYFDFYNKERLHQSLKYCTPEAIHHAQGSACERQFCCAL
jgi:putative transposase